MGEVLGEQRHLVILGDPGGGKTTLLRWLTTALMLRRQGDTELEELPDAETLPEEADWLPVLVRCRELRSLDLAACTFEDVLRVTVRRAEVPDAQVAATADALRGLLEEGNAVLLVDGLDEVADPRVRAGFCRQIDKVARLWEAPIVATSRLVGYREMGVRLGGDFAHATLAELGPQARDDFLERWCRITEPPNRAPQVLGDLRRSSKPISRGLPRPPGSAHRPPDPGR